MSKVFWTEPAREVRDKAVEYIARNNLRAALTQLGEIQKQTERLLTYPHLGRPSRIRGARELSINRTSFLVVYRILGDNIHIFRFYHTSRRR
jgi:toxin ParE1/3/4